MAFGWWEDSRVEATLSYAELDRRSRAVAGGLQQNLAPGERALLLFPPGFDYIEAFFGCLYGGIVAVPAYPPDPARLDRTLPRLMAIIQDAGATTVLTTRALLAMIQRILAVAPALADLHWIASDELTDADAWRDPGVARRDLAFLQYTSGSTASPRGVVLTHGNLLANSSAIQAAAQMSADSRMVAWLPMYHDMGLIGSIMLPVFTGFPSVLMSPTAFLMRPLRWLQAISSVRATMSGAPNFAFDLCARKITAEQRRKLDLSSWELAFCGAEPVRRDTLDRFAKTFAESGFRRQAFWPCYGLAEGTLIVSSVKKGDGFTTQRDGTVSVGRDVTGGRIAIVDPDRGTELPEGSLGEIWVQSDSVAAGYFNRPDDTEKTFGAKLRGFEGRWLRTGDLGIMENGELYVSGRLKEVIIVRGRKHFPTDIEATVDMTQWHTPHFRPGGSAVFSEVIDGEERVFVAVEVERRQSARRTNSEPTVERRSRPDRRHRSFTYKAAEAALPPFAAESVIEQLRNVVATEHGVELFGVFFLRPGGIPKTSSGKKQRVLCRRLFLRDGRSDDIIRAWRADEPLASRPKVA